MTGFCGFIQYRGSTEDGRRELVRMADELPDRSGQGVRISQMGAFHLACIFKPAGQTGAQLQVDRERRTVSYAEARLDDRTAARRSVAVSPRHDASQVSDADIVLAGLHAPDTGLSTLFGDWLALSWHDSSRELSIGSEPYGFKSLFYIKTESCFAFSSCMPALLAHSAVNPSIDSIAVVRSITQWPCLENSTAWQNIMYLPPAHTLTVQDGQMKLRRYWKMEEAITALRCSYQEAAEETGRLLSSAVRTRISGAGQLGTMLSSGLDSSSVAALASQQIKAKNQSLNSYCSVPLLRGATDAPKNRYVDESFLAGPFAESLGNVRFHTIDSRDISPLQGLQTTVRFLRQPLYATSNDHWLHSLFSQAAADGNEMILTGFMGNLTFSWGYLRMQSAVSLLLSRRLRAAAHRLRNQKPVRALRRRRVMQRTDSMPWSKYSPVNECYARRIGLLERMRDENHDPSFSPRIFDSGYQERLTAINPQLGQGPMLDMHSRNYDLNIVDPTADTRLVLFSLSLPERIFTGPHQTDRWLAREAMCNILPDTIRLNFRRGYQAADFNKKLMLEQESVERLLEKLGRNEAAVEILDIQRMQGIWQELRSGNSSKNPYAGWRILFNGLCAGLFLLDSV